MIGPLWQARAGCYSQAALYSNDSKTLFLTHLSPCTTTKKDRDISCVLLNFRFWQTGCAWAGHLARRNGELVTRVLTLHIESPNGSNTSLCFLLSSVSFFRSFAAPPLLVRCWLVLKATGGAAAAAARPFVLVRLPCFCCFSLLFPSFFFLLLRLRRLYSPTCPVNRLARSPLPPLFAPFR